MRKLLTLFLFLISVLTLRGENDAFVRNTELRIDSLQSKWADVLGQVKGNSTFTQGFKDSTQMVINSVFGNLHNLLVMYPVIDEVGKSNVEKEINKFLEDCKVAIYKDNNYKEIGIITDKFFTVSKKYNDIFLQLYEKYSNNTTPKTAAEHQTSGDKKNDKSTNNDNTEKNSTNESLPPSSEGGLTTFYQILTWISLAIALGSLGIGIVAFIWIRGLDKLIKKRKEEIENLERKINNKITENRPSSYRGDHTSYSQPITPNPEPSQKRAEPNRHGLNESRAISFEQTQNCQGDIATEANKCSQVTEIETRTSTHYDVTYLYATVKASSPYPEFSKVDRNPGDKVFMLTLSHPDNEIADFSIDPNMNPDLRKSVINDKATYLPPTFCEILSISQNPTSIEVVSSGKAKKKEGKWSVLERMKIRLV